MDIAQCVLAKDKYIICKLQTEIVKSVKVELAQMNDAKNVLEGVAHTYQQGSNAPKREAKVVE